MNIALKADGTVVKEDSAVLDAPTAFMSVNSQAIHGARPWVIAVDRPGETYFTTKGNVLYAITGCRQRRIFTSRVEMTNGTVE
ncbi:MAG: hypothetical protein ACLP9L_37170 [Thermoguttaceae bacterium]